MLREKKITIQDRNGELDFKIKEMSAVKLESWVMRAILLLASAGSDIPANKGIEGAAAIPEAPAPIIQTTIVSPAFFPSIIADLRHGNKKKLLPYHAKL